MNDSIIDNPNTQKRFSLEIRKFIPDASQVVHMPEYCGRIQFIAGELAASPTGTVIRLACPEDYKNPSGLANRVKVAAMRKGVRAIVATHGRVLTIIHNGQLEQ